jgi:hypothetical protein
MVGRDWLAGGKLEDSIHRPQLRLLRPVDKACLQAIARMDRSEARRDWASLRAGLPGQQRPTEFVVCQQVLRTSQTQPLRLPGSVFGGSSAAREYLGRGGTRPYRGERPVARSTRSRWWIVFFLKVPGAGPMGVLCRGARVRSWWVGPVRRLPNI